MNGKSTFLTLAAVAVLLTAGGTAHAQVLNLTSGNIVIDTDALSMTGDATATGTLFDGIANFDFDFINLGSGVTVTLQGDRPLHLVSYSNFTLDTVLDASGGDGVSNTGTPGAAGFGGLGILGGGDGGRAGQSTGVDGTNGFGLGAGGGQLGCCGGGTGAGYGGMGGNTHDPNPSIPQGPTYGDVQITNLLAGSGGGGGAGDNACCFADGSGGGAGGGALGLVAFGTLHLGSSAQVLVNGGNTVNSRSGGGGSGGSIRLVGDDVVFDSGSTLGAHGGSSATQGIRSGGGGGGGRLAVFSGASLTNNATVDVAEGVGFAGSTQTKIPAEVGTTFFGTADGAVTSLDLGTGHFQLYIDTDEAALAYTGDRVGYADGTLSGGVATFQLDQIDLGQDVTVVLSGDNPLVLRSTGNITVATTIDASGGAGQANTSTSGAAGFGGSGILGGGGGGRAGQGNGIDGTSGLGTGGGGGQRTCCGGGSGGGYGGLGGLPNTDTGQATPAGIVYGDQRLDNLIAGSGGGGGAGDNNCCFSGGGGGGAGGGAIALESLTGSITITSDGEILANGGNGGGSSRTGGGGSGGAVRLFADQQVIIESGGLVSAEGGIGHLTSSRGGGGGGGGRIAILTDELLLNGIAQSRGLLPDSSFLSGIGGLGSSDPAGGNPGDGGTIFYTVPETNTFVLSTVGLLGLLGWGRRRRFWM